MNLTRSSSGKLIFTFSNYDKSLYSLGLILYLNPMTSSNSLKTIYVKLFLFENYRRQEVAFFWATVMLPCRKVS
jgi:hypothetical protein